MLLQGKRAIITGAGRGIGLGIAEAFAQQGCSLVITARSTDELENAANNLRVHGNPVHIIPCDLADESATRTMMKQAIEHLGGVDILVNNAGFASFKAFEELSMEDWRQTFEVNIMAVAVCCQEVLPTMKQAGHGRIINMGSVSSLKPIPNQSAYVASKHALVGLSNTLAMEFRPHHIGVHTICPGGVDTRLAAESMPERDRSEWMTPEDIAHAALYLATLSPRATTDTLVVRRFDSQPIGG